MPGNHDGTGAPVAPAGQFVQILRLLHARFTEREVVGEGQLMSLSRTPMNIKPAGKRLTAMASPQQTVSRVFSRRGMRSRQPVHPPNLGLIAAAGLAVLLLLSNCFH